MKNETEQLNEAIVVMQKKRAMDMMLLKHQWHTTYDSIKPITLIKNGLKEITASADIKGNIMDNVMGIGAGVASKKMWVGSSQSPVKKLVGAILQIVVANIVSKNAEGIQAFGKNILSHFGKQPIEEIAPNREINY